MKKRKYGLGGDIGKYMLNNLENSALGMFGLDFYKPKYDTSVMQGISNVSEKVIGGTQKAAMGVANMAVPGLGTAMGAVQGIGKNIQFKKGGRMYQNGGEIDGDITAKKTNPTKIGWFGDWDVRNWGKKDYSNFIGSPKDGISGFNSAFRRARNDGDKVFVYGGRRFTTDLISKKSEEEYASSEKFLKDYINSDYYKQKIAPLDWTDSTNVKDLMVKGENINASDMQEYQRKEDSLTKAIKSEDYDKFRDFKYSKNKRNLLKDFEKPVDYFSITEQPKKGEVSGFIQTRKIPLKNPVYKKYIEMNPNNPNGDYTAAHELTHEMFSPTAETGNLEYPLGIDYQIRLPNMTGNSKQLDYINDASEHAARIMATRKYAFDKYKIGHRDIDDKEAQTLYKDLQQDKLGDSDFIKLLVKNPKQLKEYLNNIPVEPQRQETKNYENFKNSDRFMDSMELSPEEFYKKNNSYQYGGSVSTNKMYGIGGTLPVNPGDLDKVTGNTLQYDGNAHSDGGIPLQNGAELEKDETVIKPGVIGNENPYALSPNIVITEEAAKMFGLSKSDIGKSISDVSRTIEARKPKSQEKMAVKTNELNKKFALDKLMKANEYLSSQMEGTEQNGEKKPYGGELYPGQRWLQPNYVMNNQVPRIIPNEPEMDLYAKPQIPNANFWGTGREMNINPINPQVPTINPVTNYNPVVANQTAPSPLTTAGGESNPLSSFNLGLGLKGAALLGELATIGGKPKSIPAQYNPYKSQIIDNANLRIDNSAIKNDIASSLNTALNSSSGRSWASQRALNAQMMGNASDAQSKANLQSQEANNRYKEQLSQTYNNLGQQDVAARNQAEVLNAQTQAAWKQGIRAGIGNIGNGGADALIKHQYVQDARKDGANLNMMQAKLLVDKWSGTFGGIDNELIKLVMQAYPDQFKTEEEAKQYFSKITKK